MSDLKRFSSILLTNPLVTKIFQVALKMHNETNVSLPRGNDYSFLCIPLGIFYENPHFFPFHQRYHIIYALL